MTHPAHHRSPRSTDRNRCLLAAMVTITVGGCSGVRTSFHPTDPSFVASPLQGASPRVYFFAEDVPKVSMRSVGIVEVSVPEGQREEIRLAEAAAAEGKELGCWALVRHSVFLTIQGQPNAWLSWRSGVLLVHGSGGMGGGSSYSGHFEPQPERSRRTESFDCVLRGGGTAST